MSNLSNKAALVTGGSRGIGAAISRIRLDRDRFSAGLLDRFDDRRRARTQSY